MSSRLLLISLLVFCFIGGVAQTTVSDVPPIIFRGVVYDIVDSNAKPAAIVVNRRTRTGQIGGLSGAFKVTGLKTDTFMVTAGGYEIIRFCFRDSVLKKEYFLRVGLRMRVNELRTVAIYPVKDLSEIKKERESLGAEQTRSTEGVIGAVESPITFLYERFSQEGQSRAKVAELENRDRQDAVLKDLFRAYVRAGVIDLGEDEFDIFIRFLNLPEEYLKTAGDYDLAVSIRHRFLQFRAAQKLHNSNQR